MENIIGEVSVVINTTPEKVWEALTDPALVKQWMFGTVVTSDWKEGSPITYAGVWNGKAYEDKGTVLKIVPNELLETSFWSQAFGPDVPENRKKVTYTIAKHDDSVTVTITQDNNKDEEEKLKNEKNWAMVLESMKKLLEQ